MRFLIIFAVVISVVGCAAPKSDWVEVDEKSMIFKKNGKGVMRYAVPREKEEGQKEVDLTK